MASIGIRIEGDLRRLRSKLADMSAIDYAGLGRVMAEAMRTSTRERFKNQKSPDGKAWKPSARAMTEGGVTLTKTASLRNSIRAISSDTGFAVGTNLIYARAHQLGDEGRKITIRAKTSKGLRFRIGGKWITKKQVRVTTNTPARPFLGISEDDMQEIKATMETALEDA